MNPLMEAFTVVAALALDPEESVDPPSAGPARWCGYWRIMMLYFPACARR
ncbi:MAG: hypothetical protein OXI50_08200 [Gammaproteobacteria bacterium]|nr:hypothetical protein [Gammaproteobacteria bacterium]